MIGKKARSVFQTHFAGYDIFLSSIANKKLFVIWFMTKNSVDNLTGFEYTVQISTDSFYRFYVNGFCHTM